MKTSEEEIPCKPLASKRICFDLVGLQKEADSVFKTVALNHSAIPPSMILPDFLDRFVIAVRGAYWRRYKIFFEEPDRNRRSPRPYIGRSGNAGYFAVSFARHARRKESCLWDFALE